MNFFKILAAGLISVVVYKLWSHIKYDLFRPMINYAAKNSDRPLKIVEIGVFFGTNTRRMFRKLPVEKMYLVDPYQKYEDYAEKKKIMIFLPSSFKPVLRLLKKHKDKITPLQMTSQKAASLIPNELDMVYIDGNHAYDYIKSDIETYYPKVKKGGLIGGHDINGKTTGKDVYRAVMEFSEKRDLKVNIQEPDWWIVKPL